MKLRPLGNKVILEAASKEEVTKSGIIIPDTVDKEKPEQARVLAVGLGRVGKDGSRIPVDVEVGDVVLFSKYSPTEIKIEGKDYLVVGDEDILAVIGDNNQAKEEINYNNNEEKVIKNPAI